ncbi:hypothetical protein V5799_032968 [Amblyomma americanum]
MALRLLGGRPLALRCLFAARLATPLLDDELLRKRRLLKRHFTVFDTVGTQSHESRLLAALKKKKPYNIGPCKPAPCRYNPNRNPEQLALKGVTFRRVRSVTMSRRQTPSEFLKQIIGRPVVVKLNSGLDYRGVLACLDGYMNIALEQTEEYVNGQLKNKYGDAFIRGNNVLYISTQKRRI